MVAKTYGVGQQGTAMIRITDIRAVARLLAAPQEQVPGKWRHNNNFGGLVYHENVSSVFQNSLVNW
jgi:hypothetical protein